MAHVEQPNRSKKISMGPKICVEISYAGNAVHYVTLAPSTSGGLEWTFHSPVIDQTLENSVEAWLIAYSNKKESNIEFTLAWQFLPAFTQKALRELPSISMGNILSYGQVATLINHPKAARAVGSACRSNPFPLFIPCHRVLDAQNRLRGYSAGGLVIKEILLTFEGFHNYKT